MMTAGSVILSLLVLQGGFFRIGYTFGSGSPSMSDEKAYAEVLTDYGIDYNLAGTSIRWGLEFLTDVSSSVRLRGGITTASYWGDHSQRTTTSPLLVILTLGLAGSSRERVLWVDIKSTDFEASAYYIVPGAKWLSIGGGPVLTSVSRSFNTLYSGVTEKKTGIGMKTGVRLDQLSGRFLGLPIVFGGELGYRFQKVELDGPYTGDFAVDFSGWTVDFGTYLNL